MSTNHRIPEGFGLAGTLRTIRLQISVELSLPSAPGCSPGDQQELKTVSLLEVQRTDFSFP